MAIIKVRLKSGFGDNGANVNGGSNATQRRMVLQVNGEAIAATDPKTVKAIATAHGKKMIAPFELKMGNVSIKGIEKELKSENTAVVLGSSGKAISKEITFPDGAKVKLAIVKRGMLSKILTGKFYAIKAKVK